MTLIFGWVAKLVGERFARPVTIGLLILLVVGGAFLLGRCTGGDDTDRAQADQTTRSSDAIADAAEGAIETIEDRTVTEDVIDQAVAETLTEIDTAADAEAIRAAVLANVCQQRAHRNDPACAPETENRR